MENVEWAIDGVVAVAEIRSAAQCASKQTVPSVLLNLFNCYAKSSIDRETVADSNFAIACAESNLARFHAGANLIDEALFNK